MVKEKFIIVANVIQVKKKVHKIDKIVGCCIKPWVGVLDTW